MKRVNLRTLADNPNFIEGVHNYCDRWCERCPLTARCAVFAAEQAGDDGDPAKRDINNAAFWGHLTDIFAQTREMIEEWAKEAGVDLSEIDSKAAARAERRRERKTKKQPLAKDSMKYADTVQAWFKAHEASFEEKGKELISKAEMELPGADPEAEAMELSDAVDVIRWYQFFIHVKLRRALGGKEEAKIETEETFREHSEYDSNGSAKVVLIAIERSMAAWAKMREHFADEADELIDMLVTLDRLRRATDAEFPKARQFKRPGFDA